MAKSQMILPGAGGISIGHGSSDYKLGEGLNVGSRVFSRQRAGSAFTDYGVLVGAKAEMTEMKVPVIIFGDSMGDLETLMGPLVLAFERWTYNVQYIPDAVGAPAVVYEWECEKADWAIGDAGEINRAHHRNFAQQINFIVPRGKTVLGSIL